jgi:hypothetical protein
MAKTCTIYEHNEHAESGNRLEAPCHHGQINIAVDNQWAGSRETGFGSIC